MMPLRQALDYALQDLILTYGIPSINATFAAAGVPASLQISAAQVPIGDLKAVGQPLVCIVHGRDQDLPEGTGLYELTQMTEIRVKTPIAVGNSPEAFSYFEGVVSDTLRDLFNNSHTRTLYPKNPATGGYALPPKGNGEPWGFTECERISGGPMNWPEISAEGKTYYHGYLIVHRAIIHYAQNRTTYIGPS